MKRRPRGRRPSSAAAASDIHFYSGGPEDHEGPNLDRPLLPFLGAVGLAILFFWVSNLTEGPDHGGRYDVPAINYPAWFLFIISAVGAAILGAINLERLAGWFEARRRRTEAADEASPSTSEPS